MFAVVEFGDHSVSAVPTCWLKGEFCSWPNVKEPSRLAKASVEPKEDWKTYKVFIKSIYITFDEAKKNEKKFETTSNLENTDDENFGKGKRGQKQLPFQNNSSDDDDDIIKGSQSLLKFPPVPISQETEAEPSLPAEPPCSFTISPEIVNSIPVNYEVIAEGSRVSSGNSATNNGASIQEETLKVVLQNRFTLREHGETLNTIMSSLNFLFEKLQTGSKVQSEEVSLPVCLPLTNLEDLKVLEDSLKDENLQEYLCEKLSQIGGSNLGNGVRRILSKLMTNELAKSFSWVGLKGKEAFSCLKMTSILISAVRRNPSFHQCTNNDIETVIKDWLRHAKARCKE